jgi:phosphatidate cytidylyltransferase
MATLDSPPPTVGRAGRNLPAAIAVGLTLGGLILGTVYSPYKWLFIWVVLAAGAVGTFELVTALRSLGVAPSLPPLLLGGGSMIVVAYQYGATELFLAFALTILGCLVWRVAEPGLGVLRDLTGSVFIVAYVPFLMGFAALLTAPSDGPRRITAFIATVACSDIGGYAAGVLFGKHPMAPTVSPKKSWEGFAGSALFCAIGGAVFFVTLFDAAWWLGVLYGLAVVCSATLGDLGESMIKRDIGVKDMGNLLPGHGGLMDRLDSVLPTAPVAWLLLTAML